jgi:hypothetical protein
MKWTDPDLIFRRNYFRTVRHAFPELIGRSGPTSYIAMTRPFLGANLLHSHFDWTKWSSLHITNFTYFSPLVVRRFATVYTFVGIASSSTGDWRHNVIVTRTIWEISVRVSLNDVSCGDTGRSLLCWWSSLSGEAQRLWRRLAIVWHLQQCWPYNCECRVLIIYRLLQQKKTRRGSICYGFKLSVVIRSHFDWFRTQQAHLQRQLPSQCSLHSVKVCAGLDFVWRS